MWLIYFSLRLSTENMLINKNYQLYCQSSIFNPLYSIEKLQNSYSLKRIVQFYWKKEMQHIAHKTSGDWSSCEISNIL